MLPAGPVTWQYDISKESHLSVPNTSLERQAKSQELSLGISPKLVVSMRNKRREESEELVLTSPWGGLRKIIVYATGNSLIAYFFWQHFEHQDKCVGNMSVGNLQRVLQTVRKRIGGGKWISLYIPEKKARTFTVIMYLRKHLLKEEEEEEKKKICWLENCQHLIKHVPHRLTLKQDAVFIVTFYNIYM